MDSENDYIKAIESDIDPKMSEFVIVIIKPDMKAPVKAKLDKMGIPSQFIRSETFGRMGKKPAIYTNILRQINAKLKLDLYRL